MQTIAPPQSERHSKYMDALDASRVPNPLAQMSEVVIPKGSVIRTMEPGVNSKVAKRTYKVAVRSSFYGHVDTFFAPGEAERGLSHFPTITWAGRGGYWHDVQVTPELAAANGVQLPDFPLTEEQAELLHLDVLPSWEDGYTDKWTVQD